LMLWGILVEDPIAVIRFNGNDHLIKTWNPTQGEDEMPFTPQITY
ncbi:hypothetical protein lerEdw1_009594, partial [Lerista edwardsae]